MNIYVTESTDSSIYQDAVAIRTTVFIDEQQVPVELELDEFEKDCLHFVLYQNETPMATVRLLPLDKQTLKLQRMAVLKEARGAHYGKHLVEEAEKIAVEKGFSKIILGAQNTAIGFYEKLGYHIYGDEFMDAGIPHHMMEKEL